MKAPTRSALELRERPAVFSQRMLLKEDEFVGALQHRGVDISEMQMEALRRAGVIQPLFVVRPGRSPSQAMQERRPHALRIELANRWAGIAHPSKPVHLYSPYQLLQLPLIRQVLPQTRFFAQNGRYCYKLRLTSHLREQIALEREKVIPLVIALSALEPVYLPEAEGLVQPRWWLSLDDWTHMYRSFTAAELLTWLGSDGEWLLDIGEGLLIRAGQVDPLAGWLDLVQQVGPERWNDLRGEAREAVDCREAAELLLLFYEDLAEAELVSPLPAIPPRASHPLKYRLTRKPEDLDKVLAEYRLSPHPAVLLLLEGDTEEIIVPRVMKLLDIPRRRNFIDVFNAKTITQNLAALVAYVSLPHLGEREQEYVNLRRPPTHFFVLVDPERPYKEPQDRDHRREVLVGEVMKRLPPEYRTEEMKNEVGFLVHIETWGTETFEFAHFTNEELADGIAAVYPGQPQCNREQLIERLQNIRASGGNVEAAWSGWRPAPSKTDLARYLWPVLEHRIVSVDTIEQAESVPVVRILLKTFELAESVPAHGVIMRHSRRENIEAEP